MLLVPVTQDAQDSTKAKPLLKKVGINLVPSNYTIKLPKGSLIEEAFSVPLVASEFQNKYIPEYTIHR